MAKLEVDVCDICHDPHRQVHTVELGVDDELVMRVLCDEHVGPAAELLSALQADTLTEAPQTPVRPRRQAQGAKKAPSSGRRGRKIQGVPILTEEERKRLGR